LKTFGGLPSLNGTKLQSLPTWIEDIIDMLMDSKIPFPQRPNHILLNEYSGNEDEDVDVDDDDDD